MSAQIIKQAGTTEYIAFIDEDNNMWAVDQEMIDYIGMDSLNSGSFVFTRNNESQEVKWVQYLKGTMCYGIAHELMLWHLEGKVLK